jgi:multiple sugar transport system substrate-binding protein
VSAHSTRFAFSKIKEPFEDLAMKKVLKAPRLRPGLACIFWFSLVLTICILGAGCKGSEQGKLVFFVGGAPHELDAWESLVKDFEKESGISVDLLRQPADTTQQRQGLIISLEAKLRNPDVFLMDVAWVAIFAHSNWLEPLKDIDPSPYFQEVIRTVDTYQGDLIALPVYLDGGLLYFRRDLLQENQISGPPATWEELLAASLKAQNERRKADPDFYGFVWEGAQYEGLICNFLEFAGSKGGFVLRDSRLILDTAENRLALQFMHDLIWKYRVSPPNTYTDMKEEEVRAYFQKGEALFERNWPYAWKLHQNEGSKVKGKTGIAPLPGPEPGQSVSTLGGWHIGISRFSDAKESALKFVKYITSYEGQKKMVLRLGWNPGRRDLYEDKSILEKMPFFKELGDIFLHARARPAVPYYTQVSDITQRWISAALAGRIEPRNALQQAEREIAALLARYAIP